MMSVSLSPRSKAFRATALKTGFHAVCLIGLAKPRPAFFGDNRGVLPVRVATAARELEAADRADLESPVEEVVVLEHILVPSATHAKRLQKALDEVLTGQAEERMNSPLRHRWRDCRGCWEQDDPDPEEQEMDRRRWWGVVLEEAQRLLREGATEFPMYDSEEVHRIINKKALRGH